MVFGTVLQVIVLGVNHSVTGKKKKLAVIQDQCNNQEVRIVNEMQ